MKLVFRSLNEIGPTLAKIRKNKGYSLRKLAIKTGLNLATISKAETGNNYPSLGTLETWCKALGIDSIGFLYDGTTINMEDPEDATDN
jgi:transcriptional regulator with XRE-family HTH domain